MRYKCLIIGLGQIGMGYDLKLDPQNAILTHARAFSEHPSFELIGGVDTDEGKRNSFKFFYGLPAYTTIISALKANKPNLVVIALPTHLHYVALQEVLSYVSPKIIVCEKPLAYDIVEARQMVDACEKAGINLYVNYMRRADPGVIEVKKRIDSDNIATPIKGVVWYSKGFLNNGSHLFNLLEFWLGAFIDAKLLTSGRLWNNIDPEPDVQVEYEKGKVVFISAWEESFSHYTIELLSPSGRLRYEQGGELIYWQPIHVDPQFEGYKTLQATPEIISNEMNRYQWNVADALLKALDGKMNTLSTGRQSLKTIESIHGIIKERRS